MLREAELSPGRDFKKLDNHFKTVKLMPVGRASPFPSSAGRIHWQEQLAWTAPRGDNDP